jgi:hypothetical protein
MIEIEIMQMVVALFDFRINVNSCELKKNNLQNKIYTWSKERDEPVLSKLDALFGNKEWDTTFGSHILNTLSSSLFDHCTPILASEVGPRRPRTSHSRIFGQKCLALRRCSNKRGMSTKYTQTHVNYFSTS